MRRRTRLILTAAAATAAVASSTLITSPAGATPPDIPTKATAQSNLNALTVATESGSGYDRALFPH